jgi:hypothetical protein
LDLEPGLAVFESAGAQAGSNGWRGWLQWLRTFGDYRALVARLPENAEAVVVEHLRRVHREALKGRK